VNTIISHAEAAYLTECLRRARLAAALQHSRQYARMYGVARYVWADGIEIVESGRPPADDRPYYRCNPRYTPALIARATVLDVIADGMLADIASAGGAA
jgi:hypothetical protein